MRRREPSSPRLFSLHGHLSTHLRTVEGADQRSVSIKRYSSTRRVLSPRERGFCVVWPAISASQSPVNKFTILTIEDTNTIDSKLVDTLPLPP